MKYPETFEARFNELMPYISWTRYSMFKKDPFEFYRSYVLHEKYVNERMEYGKKFALSRETGTDTGDAGLDLGKMVLPSFKFKEFDCEAMYNGILLKSKFDSFNPETLELGEDKTGSSWSQKKVDETGQLTFYALVIKLKYGKLPTRIILNWLKTKSGDNGREATGDYKTFETKRTNLQTAEMANDLEKTFYQIKRMIYEETL